MRAPSANKLTEAFRDLDNKEANLIRAFAKAVDDEDQLAKLVEKVPETEAYVRSLYSDPYGSSMWRRTVALHAINNIIGGYGVEVLGEYDGSGSAPDYEFINMGDMYSATLIYDSNKDRLFISTAGDVAERMGNPPPARLSQGRETVIGLYPASGGEEQFYGSTDEGLRNAVSSSLNMDGEPSHFRQYQGDLQGGWKSSELVKVTTEIVDPNRYEYPVRSTNPHYDISEWPLFELEGVVESIADGYELDSSDWTFPGMDYKVGRVGSTKLWKFREAQDAFTEAAVKSLNRWIKKHPDQAADLLASDDVESEDDIAWNVYAGFVGHGVGFWEHMDADDYESLFEHLSDDKKLDKAYQDMELAIETAAREGFSRSGNPMPQAYDPQKGYRYQIFCRNQSYGGRTWEHCDYAVDRADKKHLLQNYRQAYGGGWEFKTIMLPAKYWPKGANPSTDLLDDALLATAEEGEPLTRRDFYKVWSERTYNDLKRDGLIELRGGLVVPTRAGRSRAVQIHHARESERYANPGRGTSREVRKIKNRVLK